MSDDKKDETETKAAPPRFTEARMESAGSTGKAGSSPARLESFKAAEAPKTCEREAGVGLVCGGEMTYYAAVNTYRCQKCGNTVAEESKGPITKIG